MKIIIIAEVPDELTQDWLQHVRDFDIAHAGRVEFRVLANDPKRTSEEIMEMLNIKPPLAFKFQKTIKN